MAIGSAAFLVQAEFDNPEIQAAIARLNSEIAAATKDVKIGSELDQAKLNSTLLKATAQIAKTQSNLKIGADVQNTQIASAIATAKAQVLSQTAAMNAALNGTDDEISKVNIVSGNWFRTLTNIGSTAVPLFGGALGALVPALEESDSGIVKLAGHLVNTTNGWHLMTEAVVETLAIWGPAAIAVTAFGLAATPAVMGIVTQLRNMNTAATGTGQSFQSLATSGESVTAAVKPSVLELFGEGLEAVKSGSGSLAPILATLGASFDRLGAEAVAAFGSGGTGGLFKQGSADALALANSFTSLGSIFGTLMKAVPGYAEVLLGFGNDALGAAADVTAFIEPVLKMGLALHGAILYGGLFGTAVAAGVGKILPAVTSAAGGVANFAAKFAGDENLITVGAGKIVVALEDLGTGPVLGIGLLVGALAAVVLYLKASGDAATSFNKSIQSTIASSTVLKLQSTIQASLTETTVQYVAAQKAQAQATANLNGVGQAALSVGTARLGQIKDEQRAVASDTQTTNEYHGALVQLTAQQTNVNANLQALASTYHTTIPGALAIANGAQITSNQLMDSGAQNLATLKAQAGGYVTELGVMTAGTGTLNEALNALNVTQAAQVTDAQKVAQAYSQWIGIVTGGDTAFAGFEQSLSTLSDEMAQGSAAGVKLTTTSGKLSEAQTLLGTSLNGTSASALAARQAFDSQISSATTLYGSLQTMAAASGNSTTAQVALTKAGRDLVAQLLPLAAGSQEATAEVSALAQIVGGPATDSYQALQKWVGTTKGAESDLNTQQTILTLSTANLTAAAKNLSAAVGQEITAAEAQAIAQTTNLSGVTLQLAQAFNQSNGAATTALTTYAGKFYSSLIKAGTGATTAQGDVDAFLTQLGATTGVVDQVNAALAKLPKTVTISVNVEENLIQNGVAAPGVNVGQNILGEVTPSLHAARGAYVVKGSGPAGRDSVPAMLAPGELVIPAGHAAKYGAQAKRDGIPGFASGGLIAAPVLGSLNSGMAYSFGENAQAGQVAPVATGVNGQQQQPMTQTQGMQLLTKLDLLIKISQQQPQAFGQALSNGIGTGARRAYFSTGG